MLSSIVSFLPSLHLSSSSNNLQSPRPASEYNPTDNAEEEEVYQRQQAAEDDNSAKKDKSKNAHETFIIVRPPPAKSNHPLNLQVQLVPPAGRNPRQSLDESDGTSVSLKRTPSNRSDTSSYGSTASIVSNTSVSSTRRVIIPLYNLQAHNVLTNTIVDAGTDAKIAKFQKRGIELIDLAILEPVEVWSDRMKPAAGVRNSRPVTPDPAPTTTAESSVISLPHAKPNSINSNNETSSPNATPHPPLPIGPQVLPVAPTKRNIFDKVFKKRSATNATTSSPTSPANSRYSPTSSPLAAAAKAITPDTGATPRARSHTRNLSATLSPSAITGKFRNRSNSPNPLGLGLLQVPSLDDPALQGQVPPNTANNPTNGTSTEPFGTPTPTPTPNTAATTAGAGVGADDQKLSRPCVLGIQPTLSFSYTQGAGPAPEPIHLGNLSKNARALMYVWFVRKWFKRRADDTESGGLLMGMVHARAGSGRSGGSGSGFISGGSGGAGSAAAPAHAGEGVEVRFEWKRSSAKVKARKGQERGRRGREGKGGETGSLGRKKDSKDRLPEQQQELVPPQPQGRELVPGRDLVANRLSVISHQSASTNLSASEDGHHRDRSGTPTRGGDRDRERRGSFGGGGFKEEEDDGEDSDPEDSETPWVCTLKIRRSGAGAGAGGTSSGFTTRSRRGTSHGQEFSDAVAGAQGEMGELPPPSSSAGSNPQVLRVRVGTLSPTPHHPKVVAMLKVPFPLPDIEVERLGVVKRATTGAPGARPPLAQWQGLTLTAEEIKDVVCSTAMWVVVREGFGGIGKVARKGDGWRIRA